jgi:hypothetical protein
LSRHRLEVYLDKVFDFSQRRAALPDGRKYPRIPWSTIFDAVFLGAACQFPSLHQLEAECGKGVLRTRIGPLSEDAMAYALERQPTAPLLDLHCAVARQLKRNGVLHSSWARGLVVVAVDGIEICSSFVRCCPGCLERTVHHKVDEQLREDTQYYHRISVVTVVSSPFPVPLGLRFQAPGEDEVACSLALLEELGQKLGRRFFDLLVADALYLRTPFVQAIEARGWDWVINLKDNQPELLAEAQRTTGGEAHYQQSDNQEQLRLWYQPQLYWAAADRSVQVLRSERLQRQRRVKLRPPDSPKPQGKETVEVESTNFYACHFELSNVPPLFLYQLGRSRWIIDTEVFQTLTTDSHLKKPSVHQDRQQAFLVLCMIRLLAYTLTLVFYHRQVRSHERTPDRGFRRLAQILAYLFLAPRLDSS